MTTSPAPSATFSARPTPVSIRPGEPFPLGATWDGRGTNFAVFSEVADAVDLCLFDDGGHETRIRLPERTAFCWHGYLSGIGSGAALRFSRAWAVESGRGAALQSGEAVDRSICEVD